MELFSCNLDSNNTIMVKTIIADIDADIVKKIKQHQISIITHSKHGFLLRDYELIKKDNMGIKFEDLYAEDFDKVSDRIIHDLNTRNKNGIVLLHGLMGTGKTSYLRHIIENVENKKLIYMPPDLVPLISSPDFIDFLADLKHAIIFIEDAENILQHRESGGSQAVSNILNTSDGILGNILKIQFVCTFNCRLDEVDPALLRPGRLIAEYEFGPLSIKKTENLLAELYADKYDYSQYLGKKMTLAEIFNISNMPEKGTKDVEKVKFGFMP
jgi:SpoVK/Ycf46/Vps4 family AAA+-type ATPase